MKTIQKLLLALALAGAVTSANAALVDWTLSAVNAGGASYTGTFTYDADTNFYSKTNLYQSYLGISNRLVIGSGNANSILLQISGGGAWGNFDFASALTNAGGNVNLSNTSLWNGYFTISGSLTGIPQAAASAVPEPETYAMFLAGLGLMGFAARRKASK